MKYSDPDGNFVNLAAAGIGALIGAGTGAIIAACSGASGREIAAAAVGGATGAMAGAVVSEIAPKVISSISKIKSNAPYSNLVDPPTVGPGKPFSASQKKAIIAQNMERNGGVVRSDGDGRILTKPSKSMKGVTPSPNEWQIDHINPKSLGGTNSYSNAQVLSRQENRIKSNTVE